MSSTNDTSNTGDLPDLSHLDAKVSLGHILNVFFSGAGAQAQKTRVAITAYIRLVDKALHEYHLARDYLAEYHSTPRHHVSPLFLATGHMENCFNAMARALKLAERIRRGTGGPRNDAVTQKRLAAVHEGVVKIRDAIEHVDEWLMVKGMPDGAAVALMIHEGRIELSGTIIPFEDLTIWLDRLHNLAVQWSSYSEQ